MIHTPDELTALIASGHITLHTRMVEIWKDEPPIEAIVGISVPGGPPVRCGSSTQPYELHVLLPHANAAIAPASAHDRLKIAAALEKIRAGGLGRGSMGSI